MQLNELMPSNDGGELRAIGKLEPAFDSRARAITQAAIAIAVVLLALWVAREGTRRFGLEKLAIGGESAGGHLSAVTLLRLRDRHQLTPFSVAFLNYGQFDLAMTPSARSLPD